MNREKETNKRRIRKESGWEEDFHSEYIANCTIQAKWELAILEMKILNLRSEKDIFFYNLSFKVDRFS